MNKKQKQQIETLATVVESATKKAILDKKDIEDINIRLDQIIASLDNNNKFFKRLL